MKHNYNAKHLVCLAMMLGCATSGFAQVDVGTYKENTQTATYATLKEAIENAASGTATVYLYLTQDLDETGSISFEGKRISLNLQGHKLSLKGADGNLANLNVGKEAQFTVKGAKTSTSWSLDVNDNYKVTYDNQGTLELDGSICAKNGGYVYVSSGNVVSTKSIALSAIGDFTGATDVNSQVVIGNGYIKAQEGAAAAQGRGASLIIGSTSGSGPVLEALDNAVVAGNGSNGENNKRGGTSIQVRNATLIGRIQTSGYVACGIYHPQEGKLNVGYNAKIYAIGGCGILMRGGTLTMGGAASIVATGNKTLTGKVGDSRVVVGPSGIVYDYDCGYYDSKNVTITVSGTSTQVPSVTSSADAISVINSNNADVSGVFKVTKGTYSSDVAKFIDTANGYTCDQDGDVYGVHRYIAQVGSTKYEYMDKAISGAQNDEKITMLQDYSSQSAMTFKNRTLTLDLNGKHLKCHSVTVNGGHLTIQDGTAANANTIATYSDPSSVTTGVTGGLLEGWCNSNYTVNVTNGGIVTLESGTVVNTYTSKSTQGPNVVFRVAGDTKQASEVRSTVNINGGTVKTVGTPVFVCGKGGTVNVNGGELEGSGLAAIAGNGTDAGTTINVNGGTLLAHAPSDGTASCGIYNPQDGVVNISGGTITSEKGPGVLLRSGKLNMTGGEVIAKGDKDFTGTVGDANLTVAASGVVLDRDANYNGVEKSEVKIQGKDTKVSGAKAAVELMNANNVEDATEAVEVSGGTFSGNLADIEQFVAEGSLATNSDGSVEVQEGVYAAKVGETKYETFASAFAAALEAGGTMTLLNDIDIIGASTKIPVGKTVTLDLNGKNIKAANYSADGIEVRGKLTLKDSKENSTGKIYSESTYTPKHYNMPIINVYGEGEFIMESGNIYAVMDDPSNKGQFGVGIWDNSKTTIKGGTIEAGWYAIAGNGAYGTNANKPGTSTTLTIEGGTLISTADYAIYHPQVGKLNVTDGTIYGYAGGIAMKRGDLSMTGGTVTSKGQGSTGTWGDGTGNLKNAAIIVPKGTYGNVTAKVSGGTVKAEGDAVVIEAQPASSASYTTEFAISGGTFSSDVSKYCADSYTAVPNADGTYGIETGDVMVVSGTTTQKVAGNGTLEFSAKTIDKFYISKDVANVTVKMTKNFSTTNWSSFYVPFDITLTSSLLQNYSFAKIWDTELVNDATTIEFKQLKVGDVIPAHTPCLVKATTTGDQVLEFTDVTIKQPTTQSIDCSTVEEKFTFMGTLENTTLKDKNGYFVNPQTQQLASAGNEDLFVRPCGFYMTIQNRATGSYVYPSTSTQAKSFAFRVIGDGEITGISEINKSSSEMTSAKIYNLQGEFVGNDVQHLPSGVYVINGKKVVIK